MINMDEHLEELEEGFGDDLLRSEQAASNQPSGSKVTPARHEMIIPKAPSVLTPWLHQEPQKKSRWNTSTSAAERADNLIAAVTGKFYGAAVASKHTPKLVVQQPPKFPKPPFPPPNMMIPPMGFMPPPMFGMPGMPPPMGMPPGMPPPMPGMPGMPPFPPISIPPPSVAQPTITKAPRDSSPRARRRSRSPRRSLSPRRRSRSPRRRSRSPRRRSPRRNRSPRYRSPSPRDSSIDGMPIDGSLDEENELFSKLLLKKLRAIRSRCRIEALHVDIMSMVKKTVDEDAIEQIKHRSNPRDGPI